MPNPFSQQATQADSRIAWQRRFIADGASGVRQTLTLMRRLVDGGPVRDNRTGQVKMSGKLNPQIRAKAMSITGFCGSKNFECEVKKLRDFCLNQIKYTKDIAGVETLQTPEFTLQYRQGDCDDKTILFCTLAESIGHRTRFRAVGREANQYQHVLPQVLIQRRGQRALTWMDVELTADIPVGFFPPVLANMFG